MSFQPNPGDEVFINQKKYVVDQHPAAPGMAYAQAGRQGTVYKLIPEHGGADQARALKIFYPKYRNPALVYQSENMEVFSSLPGLQVCHRQVLTPETNGTLIAQYPDMLYAVLMPWINGSTWMDVLAHGDLLRVEESWELARGLAAVGSGMEQKGLAHCDLSSPNVLLPLWRIPNETSSSKSAIELVDVEQLYSARLDPPDVHFTGSPGYASGLPVHRSTNGPWHAYADRFAGAVILAEMLCWSDSRIVEEAWGESYFDPEEMQTPSPRYHLMIESLESNWGKGVAELFTRAWQSDDVRSCPTFGEWLVVISGLTPELPAEQSEKSDNPATGLESSTLPNEHESIQQDQIPTDLTLPQLIEWARKQEAAGNTKLALNGYHKALADSPAEDELHMELVAAVRQLSEVQEPAQAAEVYPAQRTASGLFISKRWLIGGAAALVLLVGIVLLRMWTDSPKTIKAHVPEQSVKQPVPAAPSNQPDSNPVVKPESTVEEEAEKAEKAKAEAAVRAAQLEKERLAQERKKQEEAKLKAQEEAARKAAQDKFDQQLQYEKYLTWKKDRDARLAKEAADKAKVDAARKLKLEQQKRQNEQKARVLQASRDQQAVKMNASFNQAYNAWKTGNVENAKAYAWQFLDVYSKDSGYFGKNAKLSKKAASLKKFVANSKAGIPDM